MRYCDLLEAKNIKEFGIGQLVVGGFYRRPESLEILVLKLDPSLWKDAVKALQIALEKKPTLVLAKASLGVAYLVKWDGQDVPNARKYLEGAVGDAAKDKSLDPLTLAALLVNAGVAELASGSQKGSARRFEQAEMIIAQLRRTFGAAALRAVDSAIVHNRALLALAGNRRRDALKLFGDYLLAASPASAWYDPTYEEYAALAREFGEPVKEKKLLAQRVSLRPVTALQVKSQAEDFTIVLGQPPAKLPSEVRRAAKKIPAAPFLMRLEYPEHELDLLASEKAVVAIRLYGPNAPTVELRASGISGKKAHVRVGMKDEELQAILQDEEYVNSELDTPDPGKPYRFYREVGLAARLANGKVTELLILARQEK
jgi:hypothetical protein